MKVEEQKRLSFTGVDIISVDFKTQRPYDGSINLDLNVNPKVFYPENDSRGFRIIIELTLGAKDFFNLSMVAIGDFEFDKDIDAKTKKQFTNKNAPAIMFPYIRSFVSTFTSNLGRVTGSIVLPTQFFDGELEVIEKQENETDQVK